LTIRIQQAIWWHAAAYSPSANDPYFDPTAETGGMSSLRLSGTPPTGVDTRYFTSDSAGVLAGKFCDTLRSFTLSVSDTNQDGQPDTVVDQPTFGVRMGDPTLLDARVVFNPTAAEARAIFGEPQLVVSLQDFATKRVRLSYMLMAVYNSGLSLQCTDRDVPDEWFTHDSIPGALVDPVSAAELRTAMEPKPQRTSDGLDAGFFVQFAPQQDVRQLGCCGVIVGTGGSSSSSSTGTPTGSCVGGPTLRSWADTPSRTRIWAVRAGVRGLLSPSLPTWACFGPTPQELVYAEFDDDAKLDTDIDTSIITWHHAGFIILEDNHGLMFPTDFAGNSTDDSVNLGNAYDYQRRLPVDIADIAWDDRGWLWALCTGPSRTEGGSVSSPQACVDGLYRILPGGWSYQRADTISFGGHFSGETDVTARLVQSRMGGFSKVACGDGYTMYLTTDGHLEFVSSSSTPLFVPPPDVLNHSQVVIDIAASSTHAACILQDGTLRVWSMGGTGTYITDADSTTGVTHVACGDGLTCTIGIDGNIRVYGLPMAAPEAADPPSPFVSVDCGSSHVAGLTGDGRLIITGTYSDASDATVNINGVSVFACGDDCTLYTPSDSLSSITHLGPVTSPLRNPPIAVDMDVVAISAAQRHAVALAKASGCVDCSARALPWGDESITLTGLALTRNQSPLSFDGQQDKFVSVSCGRRHTCLISDGSLLEPRYAPARLVYRSKISLAAGVDVPDEPVAVMTGSSNSGATLMSPSVYDESTVILGSSEYTGNPFGFSERVGLKIYDQDNMTVRVLSANWRPHRLRVDVDDNNQLIPCPNVDQQSQSHLILPPTADLTVIDHQTENPSGLTVMQLPESQGGASATFDWSADAASFSTLVTANAGLSAAFPQAKPEVVVQSLSGVVLGVSNFTTGGYAAASAVMPLHFASSEENTVSTMGSQVFLRNEAPGQSADPSGWPQVPSICPYRQSFDADFQNASYGSCSVGREYLLRADGDWLESPAELRYLSSNFRLRAAMPKASLDASITSITAPFTSDDVSIGNPVVDNEYAFDTASANTPGLFYYSLAPGPRSVFAALPNGSRNIVQWSVGGVVIPQVGGPQGDNKTFISCVMSNSNGSSRAEGSHVQVVDTDDPTSNYQYNSFMQGTLGAFVVDQRIVPEGILCSAVAVVAHQFFGGSGWNEGHLALVETRWIEDQNGNVTGSISSELARNVSYQQSGAAYFVFVRTLSPGPRLAGGSFGVFVLDRINFYDDYIYHLPKDPSDSIISNLSTARVLSDSPWDRAVAPPNIEKLLVADGGADGEPLLCYFHQIPATAQISLDWIFGQNGRFTSADASFAQRFGNRQTQVIDGSQMAFNEFASTSAGFLKREDSTSDAVIFAPRILLYKPFGAPQFTVVSITNSAWLSSGNPSATMYTPDTGKLVVARADDTKVEFFEVVVDVDGHPSGLSLVGFYIHGSSGDRPKMQVYGSRLLLQFPPNSGDPIHLVLEIGEIAAGASTDLEDELKAATLIHVQAAPLRASANPDATQTAAPFVTNSQAGASVIYPQESDGSSSALAESLSNERAGASASMPERFHPDWQAGGRYFIENTNKAFRVYELGSAGLACLSRTTTDAALQLRAPGSLNDSISYTTYRANDPMPRSAPWGHPYSAAAGLYGKTGTTEQRLVMIGDTIRTMTSLGVVGTQGASRSIPIPSSQPISWISEMNARAAILTISGGISASAPERTAPNLPYKRVKTRHKIDNTISVPFGGGTPISVAPAAGSADRHPWVFWGKWLFRIGVSGTNPAISVPQDVPDSGLSDHTFATWFHSPTGSGSPPEGYSDYLDGYVTAASSAAGLVVANSRCHHMANRTTGADPNRMELRVFSYSAGTWSRTQSIVLSDPAVMGAENVGVKYHPHSYLPQRISMALSNDGKILAVAGHRWDINGVGMTRNTQVVIFKRGTGIFERAAVITVPELVQYFAEHMEFVDIGAGEYRLNVSCGLDPLGQDVSLVSSMAAKNTMVSYIVSTNGTDARVAECNDLLAAGEIGFTNSAAANLNHWVASPSPAYNGQQTAAWSGQRMTITTLNRMMSLQSDRHNWRITDHLSRPYRHTDAKVLAVDFSAYRTGYTCPSTANSCTVVTDVPKLPSPAGGHSLLDGRVRAAFFVPQTVSATNDAGFYQVDNSAGSDSGWWTAIGADSQVSNFPHLSHVAKMNVVQRSTVGGQASWNPSTQGSIRRVPLSGADAGVPSTIGGSFGCTVRRPLFNSRNGTSSLEWPFIGALLIRPKHLIRFQDEAASPLRWTTANSLDMIDAGAVSLTRDASNIIVLKDGIDRSSTGGAAVASISPLNWADQSKNVEDLGQFVSLRIAGGQVQTRGHTTTGIFPETSSGRVSTSSQRFGIKRPMAITVGGNSACGAGSFDIARPARSPIAPLEGRAGGRGGSPWLMLVERHGLDTSYFNYSDIDFGTRGINVASTLLRMADPFMVSLQAPFEPIGHVDRMGWCNDASYPIGNNSTSTSEALIDMMRGLLDPDNGSVFNGDRISLGTTDGYTSPAPPATYTWAFPEPVNGQATTRRCLCKSDVYDAYEWLRRTIRLPSTGLGAGQTALRVLHGPSANPDSAAPFLSRFNEDGNRLRSIVFVLTVDMSTGGQSVAGTPMGSNNDTERKSWANSILTNLRNADIIEADGSIHFVDMVKRDLSDPYRRACETLAEVSGGSYISLGRQVPTNAT
jgi:hypothetical protein